MAKKILIILLVVMLTLGITACNLFGSDDTVTETEYKVNFYVNGGLVANKVVSDQIIEFPTAPDKPGHVFLGWYLEQDTPTTKIEDDYFVSNPATADVKLYAHYARAEYKLMFSVDGQLREDLEAPFLGNAPIALPEGPVVEGKVFAGWYLTPGFEGVMVNANTFVISPSYADTTLYAKYEDAPEVPNFKVMPYSANGCTIIGLNVPMVDVVIPEEVIIDIGGVPTPYKVERIETGAFMGNTEIKSIVLPETVTSIGDFAFYGCTALESIVIPATVNDELNDFGGYVNIGNSILDNTVSLTEVEMPTWLIPYVDATKLEKVVLNGGKTIADESFKDAKKLASIALNDGLETIGAEAFSGCELLSKIHIPASVKSIAIDAFVNCSSASEITVSSGNATYESNNSHCIVEKATKTLIFGCKNTNIYEGVKVIEQYAFSGCKGLKSLYIPKTVTNVVDGAFFGCVSLDKIDANTENSKYESVGNCLVEVNTQADGTVKRTLVLGSNSSVITEEMKLDSISTYAFAATAALKEIFIPSGITEISNETFSGCVALEKVQIVNPKLKLTGDIFAGCKSIKFVSVPADMLAEAIVDNKVFANCTAIESIDAPAEIAEYLVSISKNTVKSIVISGGTELSDEAFKDSKKLESVILPATLTVIGDRAFENCAALTTVGFAEECGVSVIGHHAFSGCKTFAAFAGEKTLIIPKSVAEIGEYAFNGTAVASLALEEGSKLSAIGHMVFGNCEKLVSVNIPGSVTSVDYSAFGSSNDIKNATVPAHVVRCLGNAKIEVLNVSSGKVLDSYALRGNKNLKELILSGELEVIDARAFEGCTSLNKISVAAENAIYESVNNCLVTKADKVLVLGCKSGVIPEGVKTIASYAFAKTEITKLVIPKSVEVIESFAFAECQKLAEIVIESKVEIEPYAFDGTNAITKATLPADAIGAICTDQLTTLEFTSGDSIAAGALKNCTSLTTLIICDTISSIGNDAFKGCVNIKSVTAPAFALAYIEGDSVESIEINLKGDIGENDLADFVALKSITLPRGEYKFDASFDVCENLEYANVPAFVVSKLPESIKTLVINSGDKVTADGHGFPELVSVEFAASITEIDAKLFAESANLATIKVGEGDSVYYVVDNCLIANDGTLTLGCGVKVVIPADVTAIGDYAFAGKVALESLVLPEGLLTIGEGAFKGCSALTVESYTSTLTDIGSYAFSGCTKLTSVFLPDTVKTVGDNAFDGCTALTEIKLPGDVTLGANVFAGCDAVVKAEAPVSAFASLPKAALADLTVCAGKLEENALYDFTALKNLTIGADVEYVDGRSVLVNNVNSLESIAVDPANAIYKGEGNCVYTVDGTLVLGCNSSVIPAAVKTIAPYAFFGCENIASAVIPEGVETIAKDAFVNCVNLKSVTLSSTVTSVDARAFEGCVALESIKVAAGNPTYVSLDNCLVDYQTKTLVLGCKTSVVPSDVENIGAYAFYGVIGLTEIKIPASVKTIGEHAFDGCDDLVTVVFVDGNNAEVSTLTELGEGVFANCDSLVKVVVPVSVKAVSEKAFENSFDVVVCYGGNAEGWAALGSTVTNAVYYYSESYINDGAATYWHYDIDGYVDIWV